MKNGSQMRDVVFLLPSELAERWRCAEKVLDGMRWRGTGPVYTKVGGSVRYAVADVEAYEAERRRGEPEPEPAEAGA